MFSLAQSFLNSLGSSFGITKAATVPSVADAKQNKESESFPHPAQGLVSSEVLAPFAALEKAAGNKGEFEQVELSDSDRKEADDQSRVGAAARAVSSGAEAQITSVVQPAGPQAQAAVAAQGRRLSGSSESSFDSDVGAEDYSNAVVDELEADDDSLVPADGPSNANGSVASSEVDSKLLVEKSLIASAAAEEDHPVANELAAGSESPALSATGSSASESDFEDEADFELDGSPNEKYLKVDPFFTKRADGFLNIHAREADQKQEEALQPAALSAEPAADAKLLAEDKKLSIEEQRLAEELRAVEAKRIEDELRLAAEYEEAKRLEEQAAALRLATEQQKAEELRLAAERAAEEKLHQEQERARELKRLEEQRALEIKNHLGSEKLRQAEEAKHEPECRESSASNARVANSRQQGSAASARTSASSSAAPTLLVAAAARQPAQPCAAEVRRPEDDPMSIPNRLKRMYAAGF